ncbi:unnamed protein product [Trichogramma brassicae]|uniref:Uncharacterized protein n=1 Tax=Trichogramma brassicae TaxID=86971 RepID=A0A6H5I610_9HYME|nr:unnamed protein product [Trichogramma brassicae]
MFTTEVTMSSNLLPTEVLTKNLTNDRSGLDAIMEKKLTQQQSQKLEELCLCRLSSTRDNRGEFRLFSTLYAYAATDAVLSYEDEYYFCAEADRYNWTSHPCKRTCKDGEPPRQCLYVFVVEQYSTMSKACYDCPFNMADCYRPHCLPGDGRPKTVFTANRQMPGTPIEVVFAAPVALE